MGKYWLQISMSMNSFIEESISRDKNALVLSLGLGSFRRGHCDF